MIVCIVAFCVTSSNIYRYKVSSREEKQIINNNPTIANSFNWNRFDNIEKNNKYSYNGKLVTYEVNPNLEYSDQQVSVYLYKNGNKKELIRELSVDVPGGTLPIFKKTSNPEIALLYTSSGDMGLWYEKNIYIDLETEMMTTVYIENNSWIKITKNNQVTEISFDMTDNCGDYMTSKEGKTVFVKGIRVNKKLKKAFSKLIPITCMAPEPLNSLYDPSPEFNFKGVNKDLFKIYFSDNLTNKIYSVDLNNQETKEETTEDYL